MNTTRSIVSATAHYCWQTVIFIVMVLFAVPGGSAPIVFTNEANYVDALSAMGYAWVRESFEDDAVWGDVRTPASATTITNFSIRWKANNTTSQLTTSGGAAVVGDWGVYSDPHGSYTTASGCTTPGACGDGLIGETPESMYGVAGWAHGFYGSKLALFLNGDLGAPVGFPELCDPSGENCVAYGLLTGGYKFFGMIEPAGFSSFEFREMEGTSGDIKYVWFDEFTVAFTNAPPPHIAAVSVVSNLVMLTVEGLAVNGSYTLEHSSSFSTNAWTTAQTFTASGSETNLSEATGSGSAAQFYRLVSP